MLPTAASPVSPAASIPQAKLPVRDSPLTAAPSDAMSCDQAAANAVHAGKEQVRGASCKARSCAVFVSYPEAGVQDFVSESCPSSDVVKHATAAGS